MLMDDYSLLDDWYVLFVKTGQEDKVKERLIYRFKEEIKVLVPKRKLKERRAGKWYFISRTLFPGYVLLHGTIDNSVIDRLKGIPGMFMLLKSEAVPLKIESYEMEVLSRLICNGDIIGFSEVLVENKLIKVVDGPLLGLEGYILDLDHRKGRARVQLTFLGELRTVELGVSVVKPLE
jgi:Transcription antiterminator